MGGAGVVAAAALFALARPGARPSLGADALGQVVRGGVMVIAGARFAVGADGDRGAVADWSCSGQETLALLRVRTGQVWVFPGWAGRGRDVAATPVGRVDGAIGLSAERAATSACPGVRVVRAGAAPVHLTVRAAPQ